MIASPSLLLTLTVVVAAASHSVVSGLAFFSPPASYTARRTAPLFSTLAPEEASAATSSSSIELSESSLAKLQLLSQSLKKPRGASVGVEVVPPPGRTLSDGDLSLLSMKLRKQAKCSVLYASDVDVARRLAKEQESARGDFPGPVPVVYTGKDMGVVTSQASEEEGDGIAAVVLDYGETSEVESAAALENVGVVWKVNSMQQLADAASMGENGGGVILLSSEMLPQIMNEENDERSAEEHEFEDSTELRNALSALPKSIVTIAPLPSMLPSNAEIPLAKHYAASLSVSSLLVRDAVVGDEEDVPYCQHVVESISKKASSSFSMTGLTGSTNGHFGVSSHGGEMKWRRQK